MDNSLIAYLEKLELMAFFSAYVLIYLIVMVIVGEHKKGRYFINKTAGLLPYAYALTATLYFGYQLRNMSPDFSANNFSIHFQSAYLKIFALLALLFWIPAISKKHILSAFHSAVFFLFILKDVLTYISNPGETDKIKNDMRVFTDSVILNTGSLVIILLIYFTVSAIRNRKNSSAISLK
jgi:hypothetical protein